jgi:hypothetical protein
MVDRVLELGMLGLIEVPASPRMSAASKTTKGTAKGRKATDRKRTAAETGSSSSSGGSAASGTDSGSDSIPTLYFQAAEMVGNRIRSFNSLERRLDNVRDTDRLVLYQVRRLPGDIGGEGAPLPSPSLPATEGQADQGTIDGNKAQSEQNDRAAMAEKNGGPTAQVNGNVSIVSEKQGGVLRRGGEQISSKTFPDVLYSGDYRGSDKLVCGDAGDLVLNTLF